MTQTLPRGPACPAEPPSALVGVPVVGNQPPAKHAATLTVGDRAVLGLRWVVRGV